jgi:hypothetical protein
MHAFERRFDEPYNGEGKPDAVDAPSLLKT